MKIYFSPSTQGFYHEGIQARVPGDVKIISKEKYEEVYEKLSSGHKASCDTSGEIKYELVKLDDLVGEERFWRNGELGRADLEIFKAQDSDPKAMGSVSQWQEYRKALRSWPDHVQFPNKDFRPTSPDIKE